MRVLIVDDSKIAAERLRDILSDSKHVSVLACLDHAGGLAASVDVLHPDVVVLDLMMPDVAGLSVLRELSARTRVVVVSAFADGSPMANEALARGAAAFVPKSVLGDASGRARLVSAIMQAGRPRCSSHAVVAIAGSTGAPELVSRVLADAHEAHAAFLVVQHLPPDRIEPFAQHLGGTRVPTRVARDGDHLVPGEALIAPGERHMSISPHGRIVLDASPPLAGHRPSATPLFRSLVPYGARAMAVVLSGMGRDGADAIPSLVAAGASCIAQRPDTCRLPSMPEAAIAAGRSVRPLAPHEIGAAIRWFSEGPYAAR